jgi:hypothetical protein
MNSTGAPFTTRVVLITTTRIALITTRCSVTGYDRSPPMAQRLDDLPSFPFPDNLLYWTDPPPDADPSDEAEDILTQPVPHFTRHIN